MSKPVIKNSIFSILTEGLSIYISNIDKFILYMLFPVFGQIFGIILSFGLSLGFAEKVMNKVDNPLSGLLIVLLLALPGLLIFCKAFWEFMVAYVDRFNSTCRHIKFNGHNYFLHSTGIYSLDIFYSCISGIHL